MRRLHARWASVLPAAFLAAALAVNISGHILHPEEAIDVFRCLNPVAPVERCIDFTALRDTDRSSVRKDDGSYLSGTRGQVYSVLGRDHPGASYTVYSDGPDVWRASPTFLASAARAEDVAIRPVDEAPAALETEEVGGWLAIPGETSLDVRVESRVFIVRLGPAPVSEITVYDPGYRRILVIDNRLIPETPEQPEREGR